MTGPYALLRGHAETFGDTKPAVIFPGRRGDRAMTYPELVARCDQQAARLAAAGVGRGTRTIIMVPVGPDLITLLIALFKLGAVPVVVDPGMGIRRMLHCFRMVGPSAFVAVPVAHLIRILNRRTFRGLRSVVTVGRRWFWGGQRIRGGGAEVTTPPEAAVGDEDPLLIAFTTGSTGPAKGAEFTYGLLAATLAQAGDGRFGHDPSDVCLATSLSFGLTHLFAGATSVFPDIDYGRIARADPARIAADIDRCAVNVLFGSPALVNSLARYLHAADRGLPSLRRVIGGGAPVSPENLSMLRDRLNASGCKITVAYGATEVVPITAIDVSEILGETRHRTATGGGTCVGRPVGGIALRVIRSVDPSRPDRRDAVPLDAGEIGEVVVSGPTVSRHYVAPDGADRTTKIPDGDRVWHRTGDLGWIDTEGRVWLCGRQTDVVLSTGGPLFSGCCEGVFDAHPDVYRSALIQLGPPADRRAAVCIELQPGTDAGEWSRIARELTELADRNDVTRGLRRFLPHPSFPVDPRHNAKIDHEALARWAGRRKTGER